MMIPRLCSTFGLLPFIHFADSFSNNRMVLPRTDAGKSRSSVKVQRQGVGALFLASTGADVNDENVDTDSLPALIVFDLDGCLWRPEMYELLWYSNGRGAPFRPDPNMPGQLLTRGDEPVYLLGQARQIMKEIWTERESKYRGVTLGISSRTDQPDWARELLDKFGIDETENQGTSRYVSLRDVFGKGPIEISHDSKVKHFQRISQQHGIPMEKMLFFDNESGNCREVSKLGVTVAYCPDGVTQQVWDVALESFPQSNGDMIGLDIYGYDTLQGADRFY